MLGHPLFEDPVRDSWASCILKYRCDFIAESSFDLSLNCLRNYADPVVRTFITYDAGRRCSYICSKSMWSLTARLDCQMVKLFSVIIFVQHTASFTDGHIQSDVESASGGGDTSSYVQQASMSDVIDAPSPKPESVLCASPPKPESILSEENEFIECPTSVSPSASFASPPTSLPITPCNQQQQSDVRCRNADRLSPRRAVATMVCSDSLPAVAEEPVAYRDEIDEVFTGADEASLNRSMEVVATQGEVDAEPIPSKLMRTVVKNAGCLIYFRPGCAGSCAKTFALAILNPQNEPNINRSLTEWASESVTENQLRALFANSSP